MADYDITSKKLVLDKKEATLLREFLDNSTDVRVGELETIRQWRQQFSLSAMRDGKKHLLNLTIIDATPEEAEDMRLQYLAFVKEFQRIEAARREIERRLDEPKMEAKTMQQWIRDSAAIAALEALLKRSVDDYYFARADEMVARLRSENDNFRLLAA